MHSVCVHIVGNSEAQRKRGFHNLWCHRCGFGFDSESADPFFLSDTAANGETISDLLKMNSCKDMLRYVNSHTYFVKRSVISHSNVQIVDSIYDVQAWTAECSDCGAIGEIRELTPVDGGDIIVLKSIFWIGNCSMIRMERALG